MSEILKIEHLSKTYGDLTAVDDISFSVEKGSLFAFLGVNGAGKSTTINIICSILQKDCGTITVDGLDLDNDREKIKPFIGIVFQNTVLDELLTVKENLKIRASFYGIRGERWKQRLGELTELLGLDDILNRPFGKLSGGQKRRADIARGLINTPKLLMLDEPTTGLDPQTRKTVWSIIDKLRKTEGMTVFLTTHYMEEADNSDRVVIIDGGRIAANDTPVNLKNLYSKNYLKLYSHSPDELSKELERLGIAYTLTGEAFCIEVADGEAAKKFITDYPRLCSDFEVIKGDMDDVFLNVTGKSLKGGAL